MSAATTGLFVKQLQDREFRAEGYEGNAASVAWSRSHYGVFVHAGLFDPRTSQAESYDLITLCDVLEHTVYGDFPSYGPLKACTTEV